MPSHEQRDLAPNASFHVYNRARDGQRMFRDDRDRLAFLRVFERLLTPGVKHDAHGNRIVPFADKVSVLAYALMATHYHLVIHQYDEVDAIPRLMARAMAAYTKQFNRRHELAGPLCADRFQAKYLEAHQDLKSEIVYVHLNPGAPFDAGAWTSHHLYMARAADRAAHWSQADLGLGAFGSRAAYLEALHAEIARRNRTRSGGQQAP